MPLVADYSWHDDLPDGCPPSDAVEASGSFYRFVSRATVRAKDLVRPVDRPSAHFLPDEMCGASALSLYKDVSDVHLAQRLIPGFKNKKVAVGDLTPEMGVIKNTPTEFNGTPFKSHHDWWVPTDYTDVPPFAVVTL